MDWRVVALLVGVYLAWSVGWFLAYTRRLHRLDVISKRFHVSVQKRHSDESEYTWLVQRTSEFHRLVKQAGVPDSTISYVEPLGYWQLAKGHASALDNWLTLRDDTIGWTYRAIQQAVGVYTDRRMQSLNPLHWLVMALTVPQRVIGYVGFQGDSSLGRFLNVVWAILLGVVVLTGVNLKDLLGF